MKKKTLSRFSLSLLSSASPTPIALLYVSPHSLFLLLSYPTLPPLFSPLLCSATFFSPIDLPYPSCLVFPGCDNDTQHPRVDTSPELPSAAPRDQDAAECDQVVSFRAARTWGGGIAGATETETEAAATAVAAIVVVTER